MTAPWGETLCCRFVLPEGSLAMGWPVGSWTEQAPGLRWGRFPAFESVGAVCGLLFARPSSPTIALVVEGGPFCWSPG